jgi:hypothetical protein
MTTESTTEPRGELRWNVKSRFREYVRSLPDGAEVWVGGPGRLDRDSITFLLNDASGYDPQTHSGTIRYSGSVRFSGYRGALRVDISDPWVEVGAQLTHLTANISAKGLEPSRVPVASARTTGPSSGPDRLVWSDVPTLLTDQGSVLLGNVYAPGSDADALNYWVAKTRTGTL